MSTEGGSVVPTQASDAFGSPVEHNGIIFPKLNMYQYGRLESALIDHIRVRTRATLVAEKASEDVILRHLVDVSQRLVSLGDIDAFVRTSAGAEKVLSLSLESTGKSREEIREILAKIPLWQAIRLALKVSTLEALFRELSGEASTADSITPGARTSEESVDSEGSGG